MKTLLKNCHIISDGLDIENGYIVISDNIIVEVGKGIISEKDNSFDNIIDVQGMYAFPGFIDIHLHGAMQCHVGDGKLSSMRTIAKWKLEEGVTTFCPSTVTMPEAALFESLESVNEYHKDEIFSKVAGMHLEGPFLNEKKLGGQNPRFIQPLNAELISRLQEVYPVNIVSFAPELDNAESFTEKIVGDGIIASCAHSDADYHRIMEIKKYGLSHFTHLCNQMTGVHHRNVGAVGAALLDDDFTAEIICDTIHLCPEMIRLIFKCKDISKIMLITDSNYLNGLPDGEHELRGARVSVKNGIIRVAGTDILSGSSLRMNVALKNTARILQQPLHKIIRTTSLNQAQKLKIPDLGKIEKGYIADIVLADKDFAVKKVFVNGVEK